MALRTIGNYTLTERIGSGRFAAVFSANHDLLHVSVSIKIIVKANCSEKALRREINSLKGIDNRHIAELFEIMEDDEKVYIVTELAAHGSIKRILDMGQPFTENEARVKIGQLLSSLQYLHEKAKILHRDIKAENVLLNEKDDVLLVDFGFSRIFEGEEYNSSKMTLCGSPSYVAPEIFMKKEYNVEADIYSCGVLLYLMVTNKLPFFDMSMPKLFKKVLHEPLVIPDGISPELADLLQKMMEKDPADRITIEKIKEHPWFAGYNCFDSDDGRRARVNEDRILKSMMTLYNIKMEDVIHRQPFGKIDGIFRILRYQARKQNIHANIGRLDKSESNINFHQQLKLFNFVKPKVNAPTTALLIPPKKSYDCLLLKHPQANGVIPSDVNNKLSIRESRSVLPNLYKNNSQLFLQ